MIVDTFAEHPVERLERDEARAEAARLSPSMSHAGVPTSTLARGAASAEEADREPCVHQRFGVQGWCPKCAPERFAVKSVWRYQDGALVTEVDGEEWRVKHDPAALSPTRWRALMPGNCLLAYGSTIAEAMQWVWWRAAPHIERANPSDAPAEWTTLPHGVPEGWR